MLRIVFLVAALAFSSLAWPSSATTLNVSPMTVYLSPNTDPVTVRLRNDGDTGTLVQVRAFAWTGNDTIEDLSPTDALLASPPVFELPPGATQVIRIGFRGRAGGAAQEQAYRLLLSEVPQEVGANANTVSFAMELNLPVFVTPPGAEPAPVWTVRRVNDHIAELVLANRGSAHLRVSSVRLTSDGQPSPLLATGTHAYILPGLEHSWRFEVGPGQLPASLRVSANTNAGELDASVAVEGG